MSKGPASKANEDVSEFCKSSFTVTFAIEIIGVDVWHDCNEGWLDLGPCLQGLKIQYQLYPGRIYDLDILIWPHVAKIWCGTQFGWVRTWQFLERRWLAFSISNIFPVRVLELRSHVATVTPTSGLGAISANAKNDKNIEAFLPRLKFGERRYFAPVVQEEENILSNIQGLIWNTVEEFIPASFLDGVFDIPHRVKDVRHQDAVLYRVRETILNSTIPVEIEESSTEIDQPKIRDRRESKAFKEKEKKKIIEPTKTKFEIKLSGDSILAGAGRIISFETVGDRPADLGEIITLISSNNLPAQDDLPVIFINVENINEVPIEEMKKAKISHLYTLWRLGDEEHVSEPQAIKFKSMVTFSDHHAIPLHYASLAEITATFLDPFQIELRGKQQQRLVNCNPSFFGYDKVDRNFGTAVPKPSVLEPLDVLLAITKINARPLAKGINGLVKGEFPLYPPSLLTMKLDRDGVCTNDINGIRAAIKPEVGIQPAIVLQAQMTMDASIGYVGCKSKNMRTTFSRLYCFVYDSDSIIVLLDEVHLINDENKTNKNRDDVITGFALDTGDIVMVYIEGITDGSILRVWELLEDLHGKVKSVYSSSDKYFTRLYPDMVKAAIPFQVIKMFAPLNMILACPSVYALPALPYPSKSALLKIGRLVASKLRITPSRAEMPSAMELASFTLELCVPSRISALAIDEEISLSTPEPSRNDAGGH